MKLDKSYWTVWSATFLFFAGFYAIMVPLPLYLAAVGIPDWQIGLILGAMGITALVMRPLTGILVDSWGRRRVMLGGTAVLVIGAVSVSFTTSPILLFGLRILQATGYVAVTTAATTLISDLAPTARRASALALFGVAANVAITSAPAAVSSLLPVISLEGAFWLAGGFAFIGGLMVLRISEPTAPRSRQMRLNPTRLLRTLRLPLMMAGLFGVGYGAFFQFLPLLAERRALGPVGLLYTIYGLSIILTRLVTGRFLDRWRPRFLLTAGFLLLSLGLGGFAVAGSDGLLMLAVALLAFGSGILHPLLIALHIKPVAAAERGRASAVFYLGFDLGIGLGLWLLTPVLARFGLAGLYGMAAITSLPRIIPALNL